MPCPHDRYVEGSVDKDAGAILRDGIKVMEKMLCLMESYKTSVAFRSHPSLFTKTRQKMLMVRFLLQVLNQMLNIRCSFVMTVCGSLIMENTGHALSEFVKWKALPLRMDGCLPGVGSMTMSMTSSKNSLVQGLHSELADDLLHMWHRTGLWEPCVKEQSCEGLCFEQSSAPGPSL